MGNAITRKTSQAKTVTVAASGTTSDAFVVEEASFGGAYTPSALTSTTLTYTVCDTLGGSYVALVDSAGNAISQTIAASKAFALPAELFGFRYAKLVCGSSEAADRTFTITRKG